MDVRSDPCRRAFEEGAAGHSDIPLPFDAFGPAWSAMTARRAGRAASTQGPQRGGASASDVFLAIACDAGVPGAWEAFVREYGPRLRGLLRKRGASETEAAEALPELAGYLCQPSKELGTRTRMGTFDGSASLFSWLAVIVLRDVHRRRLARAPESIEDAADVATRRSAPAHATIGAETARRFQAAIAAAWETLTPRERLAVLLKHRDGLRGAEIARLLGVGEPRVTRLLEAGLGRLRDAVRRHMPETPPGTDTPDQAVWQALADVLARHLATIAPAPHDQNKAPDG